MNVDDIYKNKFSNYQVNPNQDWDELQHKLKKKTFLRFNPLRFNVYYIILFFSISAFASYSTFRNIILKRQVQTMKKTVIHYKKTIDSLNEKTSSMPFIMKDTMHISIKPTAPIPIKNLKGKLSSIQVENSIADTAPIKDTAHKQHVSIRKIRKTVYVKQQVVRKDTLQVLH